ncbi:MAG: phenylalanine--tRNA ligase subunit beta [Deltaproteobacteria bacterium]|nr:phenylalanine--tRNA ligase subunit beta [Deltaproteobacteria bacterium]
MKASCNWIREIAAIDASASEMAERLTRAGLEVEAIERVGEGLDRVVIAEVRGKRAHPTKDKLSLVTVFDGKGTREVVCGAPNVPAPGARVVLVDVGAVLPGGLRIESREVAGVRSEGMLASEKELGIGADHEGILVLGDDDPGKPGARVDEALDLRDEILHLSLTPNRPDCLGHLGLARELSVLFGEPFAPRLTLLPSKLMSVLPEAPRGTAALPVIDSGTGHSGETASLVAPVDGVPMVAPIHIAAPDRCARYVGTVLQRVVVGPSPFWVRHRLHTLGQRSIDRVVDVTNLVLLELGHPIHAFDLDRLDGHRIEVRLAREGERIALLDGTERTLTADDLVIADASKPIALAGVMGGSETAVRPGTKNVLLEVAWFDPRSVRRTSRRHAIHTESSHRFERGVDPSGIPTAQRRALSLLTTLAEAVSSPIGVDAETRRIANATISLDPDYVRSAIGDASISDVESRTILEGLGCAISPGEHSGWRITAPLHRPDLTRAIDLVEEVARVRGYDRVPTALLRPEPRPEAASSRALLVRQVRRAALATGHHEAVNFTFLAASDLTRARVSTEAVALANPLSEERSVMRTSLVPGLLANVSRAERHQRPRGRIFEIGRRYLPGNGPTSVDETASLAIVAFGARDQWLGEGPSVDFYDGKGAIEGVFASLALTVEHRVPANVPGWLHPRRAAEIVLRAGEDARVIGHVGEIHPDVADAHELVTRPVIAELDLEPVLVALAARAPKQVAALPRSMAVVRDLALVVEERVSLSQIAHAIREAGGPLVEDVALFDLYRGKPIAEGHKSFALRVTYRDPEATLTDARVEETQSRVIARTSSELGATLRA